MLGEKIDTIVLWGQGRFLVVLALHAADLFEKSIGPG